MGPLSSCFYFSDVDMIMADDSIVVSLEGSIPREVSNCWAYDGGIDISRGTAGSWEKIDKKIITGDTGHMIQLTSFWHLSCDIVSKWSKSNCSCRNTAVVGVVRM